VQAGPDRCAVPMVFEPTVFQLVPKCRCVPVLDSLGTGLGLSWLCVLRWGGGLLENGVGLCYDTASGWNRGGCFCIRYCSYWGYEKESVR